MTLTTIAGVIQKHRKNWCTASQNKLLELLATWHKTQINRRSLNYHLKDLREAGLIRTIKRTKRNPNGTICLLTSATCLTLEGYKLILKMGNTWAKAKIESLKKKYWPKIKSVTRAPILELEEAHKKARKRFFDVVGGSLKL